MSRLVSYSEKWQPDDPATYRPAVHDALAALNKADYGELVGGLPAVKTAENGVKYAEFNVHKGQEIDEALIVFNDFAQPLHERRPLAQSNMLRARILAEVISQANITNTKGDALPVVVFASPHHNHEMVFRPQERRMLAAGNFASLAERHLSALPMQLGRVAFIGHAQGANEAIEAVSVGRERFKTVAFGAAEPLAQKRSSLSMARRQLLSNSAQANRELGNQRFFKRFGTNIRVLNDMLTEPNLFLLRGMTQPDLLRSLQRALSANPIRLPRAIIARGEQSSANGEEVDKIVETVRMGRNLNSVKQIIVEERDHGWANDVRLFGEFALRTLDHTSFAPSGRHTLTG